MRQFNTLTGFLLSKSSNPTTDDTVEFQGYAAIGDGGAATWQHNGITGQTPSKSPAQLGDALLNDGNGNQWALVDSNFLSVESLGADSTGVIDSTLAINAALNALRVRTFSPVLGILGSIAVTLNFNGGFYTCNGSLNATELKTHGWAINGNGAVILSKASSKTAFDLTASRWGTISQLTVTAEAADNVLQGMQYGRDVTGGTANSLVFDNVTITGYFTRTSIYNYAGEVDTHIAPTYINYDAGVNSYAVIVDGRHEWGIVSDFVTAAPIGTIASNIQHTYIGGSFRKLLGGPTMWITQTKQLKTINHYITCINDHAVVLSDDGNSFTDLAFDTHFEAQGLLSCFKFIRGATGGAVVTTKIPGFKYVDHGPQADRRIFYTDGTLLVDLIGEIDISFFQAVPANGVFQPRPQFKFTGDYKVPNFNSDNSAKVYGRSISPDATLTGTVGGSRDIISQTPNLERIIKGRTVFTSTEAANIDLSVIDSLRNVSVEDGAHKYTPLSSIPAFGAVSGVVAVDDGANWSGVNATGSPRPVFYNGTVWMLMV